MNAKSRIVLLTFAGLALVAAIVLALYQIGSRQKTEEVLEQMEHFGTPEQIESLLAALPEASELTSADATGYNSFYTGLEDPNLVLSQQEFLSATPGTVTIVLGLFDGKTGASLAPSVLVTADKDRYTSSNSRDGSYWFLFTCAEGEARGGGVLKGSETGWQWVWPAEGGSEAYADFWSGHLGYLSPNDYSIELMAPLGEIAWAPDHTEFFYETVFGTSPADVLAGAQTYIGSLDLETESRIQTLEPVGRHVLNETTADVYRLAWETLRPGGAPSDFYEQEPAYLVFARPYGESTDQYEYRGSARALNGIDGLNAAVQVVYGVSDAEYTLRRDGYPGYYGLGGSGIEFLSGEPSQSQVVDTNGDAIYGVGDYWEETRWDGLTILCYVNVEYGTGPHINKLSTTRSDVSTYRGISVGATREEVLAAYPEASAEPNWTWEGDFLWWQNIFVGAEMSGLGQNLVFYFEDDTVTRIELINMFD